MALSVASQVKLPCPKQEDTVYANPGLSFYGCETQDLDKYKNKGLCKWNKEVGAWRDI